MRGARAVRKETVPRAQAQCEGVKAHTAHAQCGLHAKGGDAVRRGDARSACAVWTEVILRREAMHRAHAQCGGSGCFAVLVHGMLLQSAWWIGAQSTV